MKKMITLAAVSAAILSLQACGSKEDKFKKEYMKICTAAQSEKFCECTLGVYEEAGLDFSDLSDPSKAQAAIQKLKPEDMQKMAQCAI